MCGDAYDDEKEGSYSTLREAWKGIQMVAFDGGVCGTGCCSTEHRLCLLDMCVMARLVAACVPGSLLASCCLLRQVCERMSMLVVVAVLETY
jgi:hypothetical protein